MAGIYYDQSDMSFSDALDVKRASFVVPAPAPVRLLSLDLLPDAAFSSYGTFRVVVRGQSNITGTKKMPSTWSFPFWQCQGDNEKGYIANPGDTIEIWGASDGTHTVTLSASIFGEVL